MTAAREIGTAIAVREIGTATVGVGFETITMSATTAEIEITTAHVEVATIIMLATTTEIEITIVDVEVATITISATTTVAVAAAMIPRRAGPIRIHDQEMMAATLGFAARWKAMGAPIGAIALA
jgi:hypothetical protein